ncbi:hypothetical protein PWT90_10085 [Aphanocladium album]|nr:hypothetical protein PWT90_10085 [Aphanocladium album]
MAEANVQPADGVSPHKVDWPFNGWLVLILICAYGGLVVSRKLLLAVVLGASVTILLFDRAATWNQTIVTLAGLTLGLGSVLYYLSLEPFDRASKFRAFTIYVNLAFYASVGMMIFTPADRTFRGWCGKIATFWLFGWIVQQGRHKGWSTLRQHDRMLVFTAVNKKWIVAHAAYRYMLLTLPVFGAGHRLRLLEWLSLGMTLLLSQASGLPFAHCFGMAEVLVQPAAAGWSALATAFDLVPPVEKTREIDIEGDLFLAGLQLSVALVAAANMFEASVERSVELERIEKAKNPQPKKPPPKPVTPSYETYEV